MEQIVQDGRLYKIIFVQNRHCIKYLKAAATLVVAVLLVKTLLVTSCFIPFSGMENSLYKGEGVLVNKLSYGLRTPLMGVFGYHRWGKCHVKRGDIVLFNNPMPKEKERSIDRREVYISRCIGTPGEIITLNKELVAIDTKVFSPDSKDLYMYPASAEDQLSSILKDLNIDDNTLSGFTEDGKYIRRFSNYEFYLISQKLDRQICFEQLSSRFSQQTHQLVIPARGKSVKVFPWNAKLLCNTIIYHENRIANVVKDTLYIDHKPVNEYTFTKNYYWMASNDPININDSRLFGFVPEDHIIGKAERIWYTREKGRFMQRVE